MKAKTINIILCQKFDSWLESIDDPAVKGLVARNTIITGGAIASMLLGEPVNDYDLYFRNHATTLAVAEYYVAKFLKNPPMRFKKDYAEYFGHEVDYHGKDIPILVYAEPPTEGRIKVIIKSSGIASEMGSNSYQYFEGVDPATGDMENYVDDVMKAAEAGVLGDGDSEKSHYRPVFMSSNAITLSDRIQLILRFYGEPDQIHENYDFAHCTNFWDSRTRRLTLKPLALECLLTKELKYIGSLYPLCSVIRTRKFIQRGFTINAGQYLKMMMQISKMDLENVAVLEDQLIGVDTAYFTEIIAKLRDRNQEQVDTAYLLEILDWMF